MICSTATPFFRAYLTALLAAIAAAVISAGSSALKTFAAMLLAAGHSFIFSSTHLHFQRVQLFLWQCSSFVLRNA